MDSHEKDYSDYIQHLSNMGNMYTFLSGFMFTAIAILLTQLPDRTSLMAQASFFFMATLLDIFIFFMGKFYMEVTYLCRNVPPQSGKPSFSNIMSDLSVLLGLGVATVLIFVTLNLFYLALAQLIVLIIFAVVTYRSIFKPFYKKKAIAWQQ